MNDAQKNYCIIMTGEERQWLCHILKRYAHDLASEITSDSASAFYESRGEKIRMIGQILGSVGRGEEVSGEQ